MESSATTPNFVHSGNERISDESENDETLIKMIGLVMLVITMPLLMMIAMLLLTMIMSPLLLIMMLLLMMIMIMDLYFILDHGAINDFANSVSDFL